MMKRMFFLVAILAALLSGGCTPQPVKTVWLDEMDLSSMEIGWGSNHVKKSVDRNPLTINGNVYERGVGTHAISIINAVSHKESNLFFFIVNPFS